MVRYRVRVTEVLRHGHHKFGSKLRSCLEIDCTVQVRSIVQSRHCGAFTTLQQAPALVILGVFTKRKHPATDTMTATSGIGVSEELIQAFSAAVETKNVRFIKVIIRNGARSTTVN